MELNYTDYSQELKKLLIQEEFAQEQYSKVLELIKETDYVLQNKVKDGYFSESSSQVAIHHNYFHKTKVLSDFVETNDSKPSNGYINNYIFFNSYIMLSIRNQNTPGFREIYNYIFKEHNLNKILSPDLTSLSAITKELLRRSSLDDIVAFIKYVENNNKSLIDSKSEFFTAKDGKTIPWGVCAFTQHEILKEGSYIPTYTDIWSASLILNRLDVIKYLSSNGYIGSMAFARETDVAKSLYPEINFSPYSSGTIGRLFKNKTLLAARSGLESVIEYYINNADLFFYSQPVITTPSRLLAEDIKQSFMNNKTLNVLIKHTTSENNMFRPIRKYIESKVSMYNTLKLANVADPELAKLNSEISEMLTYYNLNNENHIVDILLSTDSKPVLNGNVSHIIDKQESDIKLAYIEFLKLFEIKCSFAQANDPKLSKYNISPTSLAISILKSKNLPKIIPEVLDKLLSMADIDRLNAEKYFVDTFDGRRKVNLFEDIFIKATASQEVLEVVNKYINIDEKSIKSLFKRTSNLESSKSKSYFENYLINKAVQEIKSNTKLESASPVPRQKNRI